MDSKNTAANNYIPVTSELQTVHYVQANSAADCRSTATTSDDRSRLSGLLRATGTEDSDARYDGESSIVAISTAASSAPVASSSAPPAYATSAIHGTIPSSQSAISILQLPPDNPPIPIQEEGTPLCLPPPVSLASSTYQIELQQGILSLNSQPGHQQYPIVWLSNTIPPPIKEGSIPNSVPLPPVSEVHPLRGAKMARLNNNRSTPPPQMPLGESDRQSTLHSYLTRTLQDSASIEVPNLELPAAPMQSISLGSIPVSESHHGGLLSATTTAQLHSAGLLTDIGSVVSSLDRASNIYSIAPSRATVASGSHALTLDTSVHTQVSTAGEVERHHSHATGHLTNNQMLMELDRQQVQRADDMMGSGLLPPHSMADVASSSAAHQRPQNVAVEHFDATYVDHSEMACGSLVQSKHNVAGGSSAAALHCGNVLGAGLDAAPQDPSDRTSSGDAKDLVETLACYRCKVCPFISFSKEGVEQHVRATHLKMPDAGETKDPATESAPKICAEENDVRHQEVELETDVGLNKDNTYICGMCEKGFSSIESCGIHMAVEHNLPVDQVHLEPLPSMPLVSLHQQSSPHPLPSLLPAPRPSPPSAPDQRPPAPKPKATKRRRPKKAQNKSEDENVNTAEDGKDGDGIVIKNEKPDEDDVGPDCAGEANFDSAESNTETSPTGKSTGKKRGRPRGSKTLGITALRKKNRAGKSSDDHLLGYRCDVQGCAVRMQSMENLEYHRKCHTEDTERFECPECKERYDNWKSTSVHLWRIHVVDMELYSCDLCSYKTYSYGKLMNMHRRIHSDERLFMCDVCGRCFKTNKQLRNHKVIHLDKRKNRSFRSGECDICNRHFSDKRMLRVHKDTVHNKLRPYLCQYCSYTASCRSTLKMHIRQHTGEKPFACELCEYRTADHNSLRRHKMRHSGEKPYKCPFCTYQSIQSSTYKTHLKNKHPGLDEGLLFSCDQCPFRTIKKENYITHVADHKNGGIAVQQQTMTTAHHDANIQQIPMQVVLPASTSITIATGAGSPTYYAQAHVQSAASHPSEDQIEVVPFIYAVNEEDMRQRILHQQMYIAETDNPEERFPILASQLKLGQAAGGHGGEEEMHHILPHASMEAMDVERHNQIMSSQHAQEQASHESGTERHSSGENIPHVILSHAQLTPVPPETILPN